MTIDLKKARADTPACETVIHFNNAGSSMMPNPVLEAQIEHLRLEAALGGYEAHRAANDKVEACYGALSRMLNCGRDEVALVENATVGWNLAFQAFHFQAGDRILTAEAEYASNYIAFLRLKQRLGVVVEAVPSDASGQLDVAALEAMIDERVKLIAVTHIPTNGGLVNPAPAIGAVARRAGVPFLLDACQSAGQMPLDVEVLGCDLLSASGRKFLRGPRGSGFLYVRKSLLDKLDPPQLDMRGATWVEPERLELRDDARRFENWEFNYAAVIGLGVAVDYALTLGLGAIEARVTALADSLRQGLADIDGLTLRDIGERRGGIVSFNLADMSARDLVAALGRHGINVSASAPSSTRLDAERRQLPNLVRASPHYFNSEAEIARFVAAMTEIA